MKELLELIAKALVEYPADVVITESVTESTTFLELHVNENDMGKVIGKQGRIAKAMRSIIRAASNKENMRVVVDIV